MTSDVNKELVKIPEDENQRIVETPYGIGQVIRTRKNQEKNSRTIYEVKLTNWKLSDKSNPRLYTCTNPVTVAGKINDDIISIFGRGRIESIEKTEADINTTYHVELTSWKLAGRNKVHCYLQQNSFSVVKSKELYAMTPYERILYATRKKQKATKEFLAHDYTTASLSYAQVVNALRYMEYDTSCDNELRADLVELMITCSNNAATCHNKLDDYTTANKFASNALVLIDALHAKRGFKIHNAILAKGIPDVKLFGEWKVKSLIICANFCTHKSNDEDATLDKLKVAKQVIDSFKSSNEASPVLLKMEKEVLRLINASIKKKKEVLKKEKLRAQAMFGNSKKEEKKERQVNKEPILQNPPTAKKAQEQNDTPTQTIMKEYKLQDESQQEEEEEEEEPWYSQHQEALILTGIGALLVSGLFFLRGSSSSRK